MESGKRGTRKERGKFLRKSFEGGMEKQEIVHISRMKSEIGILAVPKFTMATIISFVSR